MEVSMKAALLSLLIIAIWVIPSIAADPVNLTGTWSGSWTHGAGIRDAVTVQLRQEGDGNLTGKFLTPVPMDFKKASFSPQTGTVIVEAVDEGSGTHYRLEGKVAGTEVKGSLAANQATGELLLVKWTYVPRSF
jgi:hypothetical protein